MQNLKNSFLVVLIFAFHISCQTTTNYKKQSMQIEGLDYHIVNVSPERISQKCLYLGGEDGNEWRHQYLMFVLTDKNEVLEVEYPFNMDKKYCKKKTAEINKILNNSENVKMCIRNELKGKQSENESWEDEASFGPLGKHKIKYKTLHFDSICNSKKCYGDNTFYTHTCPGFENINTIK